MTAIKFGARIDTSQVSPNLTRKMADTARTNYHNFLVAIQENGDSNRPSDPVVTVAATSQGKDQVSFTFSRNRGGIFQHETLSSADLNNDSFMKKQGTALAASLNAAEGSVSPE